MMVSTVQTVPKSRIGVRERKRPSQRGGGDASRSRSERIVLYGLLVVAAFGALAPVAWLLAGSLQTRQELYSASRILPEEPQWSNYLRAFTEGKLHFYLPNSLLYTGCAVVGVLIVSSMAGYALARIQFRGRGAVTVLMLAILIIPAPAFFIAQYKLLVSMGLTNSRIGYVLILITGAIPMATLIMRGFLASQPKGLEEAAALDGCSTFGTFARIILPLARPGLVAVAVIQGLNIWNEYLMALVLFDDAELMPVQRGLMSFVSSETPQQEILLAATAISVVPVIIFYMFAQRHIIKGISSGAFK